MIVGLIMLFVLEVLVIAIAYARVSSSRELIKATKDALLVIGIIAVSVLVPVAFIRPEIFDALEKYRLPEALVLLVIAGPTFGIITGETIINNKESFRRELCKKLCSGCYSW